MQDDEMKGHQVVSHEEWLASRTAFLVKEKEFTQLREALSQARRALPWEAVEKDYIFDGPAGTVSLSDLFEGRRQLIIYQFMFDPAATAGCPHCSRWADGFDGIIVHLHQRDVSLAAVSRAPVAKLMDYQKRMGWTFKWVSSGNTDYNFDYQASFTPEAFAAKDAYYNYKRQDPSSKHREGISVFYRDEAGRIFHTYSCYARGIDMMNLDYQFLDLVPKGRDEGGRGPYWVRRHDEYGAT